MSHLSPEACVPAIGIKLRSRDPHTNRVVRVIEIERNTLGEPRRARVENIKSERRTFLTLPLAREWEIL